MCLKWAEHFAEQFLVKTQHLCTMEWHAPTACHCQNSQLFSNTAVLCAAILFDLDICKKKEEIVKSVLKIDHI